MTVNVTRTYYDSDALRHGYHKAVKDKLAKLLTQIDLGSTLGHHVSKWHPDADTTVTFNIQPGITGQMIDVRVEHTRREVGGEQPRKKTEKQKRPYLWFGVAAVDATGLTEDAGFGYSILPALFAFEPEPEDGYTWHESLELCEGTGYLDLSFDLSDPSDLAAMRGLLAQDVGEYESQGALDPERWQYFGAGEAGQSDFEGQNIFSTENMCLDYTSAIMFNGQGLDGTVKVTKNNMVLAGAVATPLLAPDAAYDDDHDLEYWQASVIVDPEGIRIRRDSPLHFRLYNEGGVTFSFSPNEDKVIVSKVVGGTYRINVGAMGFECDTHAASIKARLILGRAGGAETVEGDRDATEDEGDGSGAESILIVDFDCDGIGSSPSKTVLNTWYARSKTLGGAHLWNNGAPGFGQMAYNAGLWDKTVMVDVANSVYALEDLGNFPPYWGGGSIVFNSCDEGGQLCEEGNNGVVPPEGFSFGDGPDEIINMHYRAVRAYGEEAPPGVGNYRPGPSDDGLRRQHQAGDILWASTGLGLLGQIARVGSTCNGEVQYVIIEDGYWKHCKYKGYQKGEGYFAVGAVGTEGSWSVGELVYIGNLYFDEYGSNPPLNVPLHWRGKVVVQRVGDYPGEPNIMDKDLGDALRCVGFNIFSGSSYWGDEDQFDCDEVTFGGIKAFLCVVAENAVSFEDGAWVSRSVTGLEYDVDEGEWTVDGETDEDEAV